MAIPVMSFPNIGKRHLAAPQWERDASYLPPSCPPITIVFSMTLGYSSSIDYISLLVHREEIKEWV